MWQAVHIHDAAVDWSVLQEQAPAHAVRSEWPQTANAGTHADKQGYMLAFSTLYTCYTLLFGLSPVQLEQSPCFLLTVLTP